MKTYATIAKVLLAYATGALTGLEILPWWAAAIVMVLVGASIPSLER